MRYRTLVRKKLCKPKIRRIYEKGSCRFDERPDRPDAGPFPDRKAQCRPAQSEVAEEDIVHVAAMVHDINDAGLGAYSLKAGFVGDTQANAVEQPDKGIPEPASQAKIEVSVEGGNNLLGIILCLSLG